MGAGRWRREVVGSLPSRHLLSSEELRGKRHRLPLVRIVGARDPPFADEVAALVLSDMRDLMSDQFNAGNARRIISAGREVDLVANGHRARAHRCGRARGAIICVHADVGQIRVERVGERA